MDIKGKTALVTGASGFIGSHLTQLLVMCGATVRAFVRYHSLNSLGFHVTSICLPSNNGKAIRDSGRRPAADD